MTISADFQYTSTTIQQFLDATQKQCKHKHATTVRHNNYSTQITRELRAQVSDLYKLHVARGDLSLSVQECLWHYRRQSVYNIVGPDLRRAAEEQRSKGREG